VTGEGFHPHIFFINSATMPSEPGAFQFFSPMIAASTSAWLILSTIVVDYYSTTLLAAPLLVILGQVLAGLFGTVPLSRLTM